MARRIAIVLALMAALAGLSSWVAMEGTPQLPADFSEYDSPQEAVADQLIRWREDQAEARLGRFVANLAADIAPGCAEALPPGPSQHTECVGTCGATIVAVQDYFENQCIRNFVGESPACQEGEGGAGEPRCGWYECLSEVPCIECYGNSWDAGYAFGAACYEALCGGHGTDCSPTNPWC